MISTISPPNVKEVEMFFYRTKSLWIVRKLILYGWMQDVHQHKWKHALCGAYGVLWQTYAINLWLDIKDVFKWIWIFSPRM